MSFGLLCPGVVGSGVFESLKKLRTATAGLNVLETGKGCDIGIEYAGAAGQFTLPGFYFCG